MEESSEIGKKLTDYEEKCEEGIIFPKEKWDDLIVWHPISNIPVEEIYKDLSEVKQFHENYENFWLKTIHNKGR